MPSVNVGPKVAKPTHDLRLSWQGNDIGLNYDGDARALLESPYNSPPMPFQWKQETWEGGRANARATTDQSAYFDAGSMWTLTPETLHPSLQWGRGTGIVSADEYNPQTRNVSWRGLYSTERYIATSFVASATYNAARAYIWIMRNNNPGTLTVELWSDTGGSPNAALKTATITTTTVTDVLSLWQIFSWATVQALSAGTTYWLVAYGASTDDVTNHWKVGIDAAPATYSKYSTAGSTWAAGTYKMYFRSAAAFTRCDVFQFRYYDAQFAVTKANDQTASKLYINGDLCKASAANTTTFTKTSPITWTTDCWAGAMVQIVGGAGVYSGARRVVSNTATVLTFTPALDSTVTVNDTTIFVIYSTPKWTEIGTTGLGWVFSQPVVANEIVYFPINGTMRRMYFNTATGAYVFADDGTNNGSFLAVSNGYVWQVKQTATNWQASYAPFVAQGTNLTFTGAIIVGNRDYYVTGMLDHQGSVYIFRRDGIRKIVNNYVSIINIGMEKMPTTTNGRAALSFGDSLYFGFSHSYERMTNGTIDDIGWWRHEGMPTNREAVAIDATSYLSWIFVGLDADTTGVSSVLCWNGMGWHEIFRANSDGYRIRSVTIAPGLSAKPRMWIFLENEPVYIDFPLNAINPLRASDTVYMHESYLVTSTIDLGKVNFDKIFKDLLLQTKNLSDTAHICADYQTDNSIGGTTWTQIEGGRELRTSPIDKININLGNASMIRLRLRVYTSTAITPPIVYAAQMNGTYIEPPRYQWSMAAKVTAAGNNDFRPDSVVSFLKDAAQNMRLLKAGSSRETLHDKWVYISQPTITEDSRDPQSGKWDGRITFTIREA